MLQAEGAIHISNFDIPEDVEFNLFDEFYDFISENINLPKDNYSFYNKIKKVKEGLLSIELDIEERLFVFGMYYYAHSVLFITYNYESKFRDKEKNVIDNFISSFRIG